MRKNSAKKVKAVDMTVRDFIMDYLRREVFRTAQEQRDLATSNVFISKVPHNFAFKVRVVGNYTRTVKVQLGWSMAFN